MKLPFDFGIKLFFRMIIPGFFLSLGILPVLFTFFDIHRWSAQRELVLAVTVVVMGWVVIVLDMPIYMLFEGRRFWPAFVWRFFRDREGKRLARLQAVLDESETTNTRKYLEASVGIRQFPLDEKGHFIAMFPSRLGNLITAFETYADTRYGADAVFYWPRIWVKLDKDLREEVDNQQALADSTVYVSFALYFAGLMWFLYSLLKLCGILAINYAGSLLITSMVAIVFLLTGYLVYRLAAYTNAQFGEVFKSVFDIYAAKLDSEMTDGAGILTRIRKITGELPSTDLQQADRLKIIWRYLHNYRIKCTRCGKVLSIPDAKTHHCSSADPP